METKFTREPCKVIHLTSEDRALIEDLEALAEIKGKPRDHFYANITCKPVRTDVKAICSCGRCLSCQIADEIAARREEERVQALHEPVHIHFNTVSYIAPEDARRIFDLERQEKEAALLREQEAQRRCHEEQLEIRRQKEDKAFADALHRYTELQQRTIWQRIKALFGGGE
jgi:hypothetical protein